MFSRITGLGRQGRSSSETPSISETTRLVSKGRDATPPDSGIDSYLDSESQQTVDTSDLAVPVGAKTFFKELIYFSNAGYLVEFVACALITLLGFKYVFTGCLLVGGCMLGLGLTTGWLCIPQVALPFIRNPFVRWFIITNHSYHLTGVLSILGGFVGLSYFSWTNSCKSESTWIQAVTTTVLALLSICILLFFIACVRDEKGNGGYIKWLLRLVF